MATLDEVHDKIQQLVNERKPSGPVYDLIVEVVHLYEATRQTEWDRKSLAFAVNNILSLYDNRKVETSAQKFKLSF